MTAHYSKRHHSFKPLAINIDTKLMIRNGQYINNWAKKQKRKKNEKYKSYLYTSKHVTNRTDTKNSFSYKVKANSIFRWIGCYDIWLLRSNCNYFWIGCLFQSRLMLVIRNSIEYKRNEKAHIVVDIIFGGITKFSFRFECD